MKEITLSWMQAGLLVLAILSLSGALTFFLNASFLEEARERAYATPVLAPRLEEKMETNVGSVPELMESDRASALAGSASLYKKKKGIPTTAFLRNLYLPEERLGGAMILTSDGWLATVAGIVPVNITDATVEIDGKMYDVRQRVDDKASGVVFLKITASNLSVTRFGESESSRSGESVFVVTANGGIIQTFLQQSRTYDVSDASKAVLTTERLGVRMRVGAFSGAPFFLGDTVVNGKGEAIGLISVAGKDILVLPLHTFRGVLGSVLKNGRITRVYFGARYVDISAVTGFRESNTGLTLGPLTVRQQVGAYVYDSDPTLAVEKNSPAAKAGLRFGDVIRKVDGVDIDARHNLTEALQEYTSGDTVNVVFERAGETREVNVVLGEGK